jgi:hypothetical protein
VRRAGSQVPQRSRSPVFGNAPEHWQAVRCLC